MLKMLYIIWTENGFVVAKLKYSLHRGTGRVSTFMPNMYIMYHFLDSVLRFLSWKYLCNLSICSKPKNTVFGRIEYLESFVSSYLDVWQSFRVDKVECGDQNAGNVFGLLRKYIDTISCDMFNILRVVIERDKIWKVWGLELFLLIKTFKVYNWLITWVYDYGNEQIDWERLYRLNLE